MLFRVSLAGAVSPGGDLAYQSNLHMPFSPLYLPLFLSLSLSLTHTNKFFSVSRFCSRSNYRALVVLSHWHSATLALVFSRALSPYHAFLMPFRDFVSYLFLLRSSCGLPS